jgi:hypothetical protein
MKDLHARIHPVLGGRTVEAIWDSIRSGGTATLRSAGTPRLGRTVTMTASTTTRAR